MSDHLAIGSENEEPVLLAGAEPGTKRNLLLKVAFLTSLLSKIASLLVIVLAMPMAIQAIGSARMAAYVTILSGTGWVVLTNFGNGPGLTKMIVQASAADEPALESKIFSNAVILVLGSALVALLLLAVQLAPPLHFLLTDAVWSLGPEASLALMFLTVLMPATMVGSLGEVMNEGYREQYVTNKWNVSLSILQAVALLIVARFSPTLPSIILAYFGPLALTKLGNLGQLLTLRRPHLRFSRSDVEPSMMRTIVVSGLAFFMCSTGSLLGTQLTTWIAAHAGQNQAKQMGALVLLYTIAMTGVGMITVTLWPSILEAYARRDRAWIFKTLRYTILAMSVIGLGAILVFGIGTGFLAMKLYKVDIVDQNHVYLLFGLYFAAYALENAAILFMAGLEELGYAAKVFLVRALFLTVVSWPAMKFFGISGLLAAGFVSVVVGSLPILALRIRKRITQFGEESLT